MSVRPVPPLTAFLLLGTAFLSGCWWAKQSDLPGRYLAEAEWGQSVLELRSDGRFIEEATKKDGAKRYVEGKWEYRNHALVREPCLQINHLGVPDVKVGVCVHSVEGYGLDHVAVVLDPDFGLAYRK